MVLIFTNMIYNIYCKISIINFNLFNTVENVDILESNLPKHILHFDSKNRDFYIPEDDTLPPIINIVYNML